MSLLIAATALPAYAQQTQKRGKKDNKNAAVHLKAQKVTGEVDKVVNAERNVEIVRDQTVLKADTACFKQIEDEVDAAGHVNMLRYGDFYTGDQIKLNLDSGKGFVLNPTYKMELKNAQGRGSRMDFLNEDAAIVTNGTFSTCNGPKPDWYISASRLNLDEGRDVGAASGVAIHFKGVTIPGIPALSFSLSGARRSGWLSPSVGGGSKGAFEVMVPYYVNIAPNRDLTLYPKLVLTRGFQMGALGRYIGETAAGPYAGETFGELLLNDQQTHTTRWLLNSKHSQAIAPGWSYAWNVRGASDDNYPTDFSKSISTSAERQLLRELRTDVGDKYWSLAARVQTYQVLQDPGAAADKSLTVPRPYDRLPQLNFHTGRYDVAGFDWSIDAETTRFAHPTLVRGDRELLQAQLSWPLTRPGYFFTPKLMLHSSAYQLQNTAAGMPDTLTRTLPTLSLDSGMVFEKNTTLFNRAITQTLEPRLFYVYTPYKDQSKYPNFDSAVSGFSFAQIFSENRFLGADRIGDANQVTAAVVSRFIESNGAERLRLALGQRFYFREQRVALDATTPSNESRSDLLAAASGRLSQEWNFDSAIQYNASASRVYSANAGLQWSPGAKKVVNAEYRYLRDAFRNVDVSTQWPLSQRWYGVSRLSYSLRDSKILEGLVGLEYSADCWIFRMGAQRFVTAAQHSSTPYFFQLELNGLSPVGFGNALESFYKGIPGYTRLNQGASR